MSSLVSKPFWHDVGQDAKHPAENLVKGLSVLKWLGSPTDRSGRLEATFQLQSPCTLGFIDIGTIWAFSLQILVGKSTRSADQEYKTLLSGVNLMTPKDCRQEQNKQKLRMFKYDEFEADTRDESWDRLKVVLTQPFRKDRQMGISLLRFTSKEDDTSTEGTVTQSRLQSKETANTSPCVPRSGQDIEKHFFGKKMSQSCVGEQVKSKLIKIEGSAEHGISREEAMSRHAKLVLAAVSKTPVYKTVTTDSSKKPEPRSAPPTFKKRKVTFEEEVDNFLKSFDSEQLDLEKVTFADLRHKLEKQKCRKLSKEEKATFFKKTELFISDMVLQEDERDKKKNLNMEMNLDASPLLKSKKSVPSRSFLSTKHSSSQNLHLRLDAAQNSIPRLLPVGSIKMNSSPEIEYTKSTQDLDLKLSSQTSEMTSKKSPSISINRKIRKGSFGLSTQDLKLQLEQTQNTEDASLHLDTSGASDELKLKLDSSTEDQLNTSLEPLKEDRFCRDSKSTIKAQRSFISQVQNALTNGVKNVMSQVLTACDKKENKHSCEGKESHSKINGSGELNQSLMENDVTKENNSRDNDDVWLSTTRCKDNNNTKIKSSNYKRNVQSEKGMKRKSESLSTDEKQKRRRKTKSGKKEICQNCQKSFSQKEMMTHKQLCGEFSSDSEAEVCNPAEVSSQIETLLAERSKGNDALSVGAYSSERSRSRKKSKRDSGKMENCPNCQKSFTQREMVAHMQLCSEFSSESEAGDIGSHDMSSQIGMLLANRKSKVTTQSDNPYLKYEENMQPCPMCSSKFPAERLPLHVEQCITKHQSETSIAASGECPICAKKFNVQTLEVHVNQCVDSVA